MEAFGISAEFSSITDRMGMLKRFQFALIERNFLQELNVTEKALFTNHS